MAPVRPIGAQEQLLMVWEPSNHLIVVLLPASVHSTTIGAWAQQRETTKSIPYDHQRSHLLALSFLRQSSKAHFRVRQKQGIGVVINPLLSIASVLDCRRSILDTLPKPII